MYRSLSFSILVFLLIAFAHTQDVNLTCTKQIVESYGLISYDEARKERLFFCPNIQYSCCPAHEQFKMHKVYSETAKPVFILLFETIKREFEYLETEVSEIFASGVIQQKIESESNVGLRSRLQYSWNKIAKMRPKTIFQKLRKYHRESSGYVASWKSAFFCAICSFENHGFIDLRKQEITYSASSCDAFVQNTLMFVHLMNDVLIGLLSGLTEIIARLNKNSKYQKLHEIKIIVKAIRDCAEDFKTSDTGLGNCKSYCEYFNMLKDNFVYEGYPEFFANTIVTLRQFKEGGDESSRKRILNESKMIKMVKHQQMLNAKSYQKDALKNVVGLESTDKLKFKSLKRLKTLHENGKFDEVEKAEQIHQQLSKKRILAENEKQSDKKSEKSDPFDDPFDPRSNKTLVFDIFDRQSSDPNFDEAMVNKMVQVYKIFNSGDPELFAQLLRKYYAEYFLAELDDIDSKFIFKEKMGNSTDLSKFATVFNFGGIDLDKIVKKIDWNLSYKQIEMSLTATGDGEIEIIFQDVIMAVNGITNRDIEKFYRHQSLKFHHNRHVSYNQTMNDIVKDLALGKLKHLIAEKMQVYNYLVRNFEEEKAQGVWLNIEALNSQYENLYQGIGDASVTIFNTTGRDGRPTRGIEIVSGFNETGFANVTRIGDIRNVVNDYRSYTTVQKVSANETNSNNSTNSTTGPDSTSTLTSKNSQQRRLKLLDRKVKEAQTSILKTSKRMVEKNKLKSNPLKTNRFASKGYESKIIKKRKLNK